MPQQAPLSPLVGKQHVHHSYIWLGSIQAIFGIIVAGIITAFSSLAGVLTGEVALSPFEAMLIVGGMIALFVVIALIVVLSSWWSYRHLYFELGDEEFNLYSGIFNKKHVHVPYRRVQSVDQHATLIQRIFGVCTVNIDTAGGSNNKAVRVPYLQKARAEQLRAELFARKTRLGAVQSGGTSAPAPIPGAAPVPGNVLDAPAELWQDVGGVFAGGAVDIGRVTYEYGMTNKELVFTGLSNNTAFALVVVGLIAGALQLLGNVAAFIPGQEEAMMGFAESALRLFGGNLVAVMTTSLLGVAVFVWAISALGTCISYGGFKARRRDSRIEVEYGLLQHRFQGVDVSRVQSVTVTQSFVRRLLGYCEISLGKIDAAAESGDAQQQNSLTRGLIIHPFVKVNRVPEILAGIIPEFADVPTEVTPLPKVALRRAVLRRALWQGSGFWLAVSFTLALVAFYVISAAEQFYDPILFAYVRNGAIVGYAVCALLLVFDIVAAVLWFRGSSFAYNRRFMQVTNGGFSRVTVNFPRKKIQFGHTRTNPFQRLAHTATINARTAAGVGGTTIKLIDVPQEAADAWLEWLQPHPEK